MRVYKVTVQRHDALLETLQLVNTAGIHVKHVACSTFEKVVDVMKDCMPDYDIRSVEHICELAFVEGQ